LSLAKRANGNLEGMMMKPSIALIGAALLLGACSEPQAVTAPPPPAPQAMSYMVFFDWDRYDLSQQALGTIHQAAEAFRATGQSRVTATGHTDTSGSEQYNMALSLRRANTVKNALVREGVPASAISVVGKGETDLLVQTADGVREPQNRRVVIDLGQMASGIWQDPASYCKALSDKYRQYKNRDLEQDAAAAMDKCHKGNYAEGIPVLEDFLIGDKIPLPSPGYRWPGRSYSPS
jgi:outer membrane protein OmpA-like peptidoglycan-associated protein